jgi:hypothetical protein
VQYPTFLIIGVTKGGTTALYHQLMEHPSVFMTSQKEARYFAYDPVLAPLRDLPGQPKTPKTLEEYQALFTDVKDGQAAGDASPIYMNSPIAAERIHAYNPGMRLIAVLRHPVERAYSEYMMMLNWGIMPIRPFSKMFRECILTNPSWRNEPFTAYGCITSLYHDNLSKYYKLFPREQILVLKHEDLLKDADASFEKIFRFIGVDPSFRPDTSRRYHVGKGVPRNGAILQAMMRPSLLKSVTRTILPKSIRWRIGLRLRALGSTAQKPLDPKDRQEFMEVFRADTLKTQELTNLDLSNWLAS